MSNFHPGPTRVTQLVEAALPQLDQFQPESFCALLFALAGLRCRPGEAALPAMAARAARNEGARLAQAPCHAACAGASERCRLL